MSKIKAEATYEPATLSGVTIELDRSTTRTLQALLRHVGGHVTDSRRGEMSALADALNEAVGHVDLQSDDNDAVRAVAECGGSVWFVEHGTDFDPNDIPSGMDMWRTFSFLPAGGLPFAIVDEIADDTDDDDDDDTVCVDERLDLAGDFNDESRWNGHTDARFRYLIDGDGDRWDLNVDGDYVTVLEDWDVDEEDGDCVVVETFRGIADAYGLKQVGVTHAGAPDPAFIQDRDGDVWFAQSTGGYMMSWDELRDYPGNPLDYVKRSYSPAFALDDLEAALEQESQRREYLDGLI